MYFFDRVGATSRRRYQAQANLLFPISQHGPYYTLHMFVYSCRAPHTTALLTVHALSHSTRTPTSQDKMPLKPFTKIHEKFYIRPSLELIRTKSTDSIAFDATAQSWTGAKSCRLFDDSDSVEDDFVELGPGDSCSNPLKLEEAADGELGISTEFGDAPARTVEELDLDLEVLAAADTELRTTLENTTDSEIWGSAH